MAVVSKCRAISLLGIMLVSLVVIGETKTDGNESASDTAPLVKETKENSDDQVDVEEQDQAEDEAESLEDSEKVAESEHGEPYTRLPVQTRINPNQNVDLPQDI